MRPYQSTLRAATVHAQARQLLLAELELRDYKQSLPAPRLAALLLLAACWNTSLSGACALVKGAPSHETVRKALYACLPPRPRTLLARLLAALRRTLPPQLGAVPQVMALDLHQRPYYGRATRGVTRRRRKRSTRKSFTYATLAVLGRWGRFSVGLLPTRPYLRLTTILEELLRQAQQAGLSVAYLLVDKEFYAAEVIDWLQRRGVAFLMPAQRRGRGAAGGNQHLFAAAPPVGWYNYRWTAPRRRRDFAAGKRRQRGTLSVVVRMCVGRHQRSGKPLVYACGGLGSWPPAAVVREYRRRFGIEAKYRQLGQCLGRTSSRDERWRLLLVGLALLLCNLWAYLHCEVFGSGPVSERQLRLARLRLTVLVRALAQVLVAALGGPVLDWPTEKPLPHTLATLNEP